MKIINYRQTNSEVHAARILTEKKISVNTQTAANKHLTDLRKKSDYY